MSSVPTKEKSAVVETEDQLIARAQEAVSHCRWVVGECAAQWTKRYARGRTDADFGALVGLTGDQIYQRRRVWETFGSRRENFPSLKWSHFYSVLVADDALDCLHWAEEVKATVAEMKAWRRAQRGEDLTVDATDDDAIRFIPTEPEPVLLPGGQIDSGVRGGQRSPAGSHESDPAVLAGVAREVGSQGEEYAPFRATAGSPAPQEGSAPRAPSTPVTAEQLVKRMTATLERCLKVCTSEFRKEFRKLPEPVRDKFLAAAENLHARVADWA